MKPAYPFLLALLLAGCTYYGDPIVDTKGVDPDQYARDLAECEAYRDEVESEKKVATGAVSGAVIWGAIGAIFDSTAAAQGAGAGAIGGAAQGGNDASQTRHQVVTRCLRNRGYSVLNG